MSGRDKSEDEPLLGPTKCLMAALSRAQRAVHKDYEAALKPTGITPAQFTLLTTLAKMGALPVSRLAAATGTDRTTISRNISPLVRNGLIENKPGDDQRVRWLGLTTKGQKTQTLAETSWRKAQKSQIDRMGPKTTTQLLDLLNRLE